MSDGWKPLATSICFTYSHTHRCTHSLSFTHTPVFSFVLPLVPGHTACISSTCACALLSGSGSHTWSVHTTVLLTASSIFYKKFASLMAISNDSDMTAALVQRESERKKTHHLYLCFVRYSADISLVTVVKGAVAGMMSI